MQSLDGAGKLKLCPVMPGIPGICRVTTDTGMHVGNLKLIGNEWKFKAIGYDTDGQVIPGGGILTSRHNTRFPVLDEYEINRVLS